MPYLFWSGESDFTEIQSMLPRWTNWTFHFPLRGAVCSQTRCASEWAPPGFPSGRIEEKLLIGYSQEQIAGCTCSGSLTLFLWMLSLDEELPCKAGSALPTASEAPFCPALKVPSCTKHVKPQQTCLAVPFCSPSLLPGSLCIMPSSQGYFSHTRSFYPLWIL